MNKKDAGVWMYEYDETYPFKYEITNVRYILGETFDSSIKKSLVCIGVNPSMAIPENLDPTLHRISKYAKVSGIYGSWYMLNVYPQRATDPDQMDEMLNEDIHLKNLQHIENLFKSLHSADVWCAWGSIIEKRSYLRRCLKDIVDVILPFTQEKQLKFLKRKIEDGSRLIKHPLHPLASIRTKGYEELDLNAYIKQVSELEVSIGLLNKCDNE